VGIIIILHQFYRKSLSLTRTRWEISPGKVGARLYDSIHPPLYFTSPPLLLHITECDSCLCLDTLLPSLHSVHCQAARSPRRIESEQRTVWPVARSLSHRASSLPHLPTLHTPVQTIFISYVYFHPIHLMLSSPRYSPSTQTKANTPDLPPCPTHPHPPAPMPPSNPINLNLYQPSTRILSISPNQTPSQVDSTLTTLPSEHSQKPL
jgi:hypothetical protein